MRQEPINERHLAVKFSQKQFAAVFKALGDKYRIQLLLYLMNGERCVCCLLRDPDITQSTLYYLNCKQKEEKPFCIKAVF